MKRAKAASLQNTTVSGSDSDSRPEDVEKVEKDKKEAAADDCNIVSNEETEAPQQTREPGAVAVDGPDASDYDNDDELHSVTEASAASENPMDPISARLVSGSEQDLEALQEQVEKQSEQLRQQDERLQNVLADIENAAVAQVVVQENGSDDSGRGKRAMSRLCSRRRKWAMAITAVLIIVGVVLGVVLSRKSSPADTAPTLESTSARQLDLIDMLSSLSLDGGAALQTDGTPQNQALNWLVTNANIDEYSDERKIQRYVLATLYYSTNGDGWYKKDGWLTDADECEWYNGANTWSFCVGGLVSELDLYTSSTGGNNLVGTIPDELALLSNSVEEFNLSTNRLTGTIPTSIGLMSRITYLYLDENSLQGTIPSEIFSLPLLSNMWLKGNDLVGSIPSQIASTTDLDHLYLEDNNFSGTIPSELASLSALEYLWLYDNNFSGTIPSELASLSALDELWLYNNNFSGNYTCPSFIDSCLISCDDESIDACRSL